MKGDGFPKWLQSHGTVVWKALKLSVRQQKDAQQSGLETGKNKVLSGCLAQRGISELLMGSSFSTLTVFFTFSPLLHPTLILIYDLNPMAAQGSRWKNLPTYIPIDC